MDEFILRKSMVNFSCIPSIRELQGNVRLQLPKSTSTLFSLNFHSESSLIKFSFIREAEFHLKHNHKQASIYHPTSKNNETASTNQIL